MEKRMKERIIRYFERTISQMERFAKTLFIVLWGLLYFSAGFAASNEVSFDSFTQESGLPNNLIQTIYQDHKGWMWIGTSQGLSRFDGYEFVNFVHSDDDTTSLNGNLVRVIFEDNKERLLVGTENGGLNVFDRELETFYCPYENNLYFSGEDRSVNDIEQDASGNLWLATNHDILIIDTLGTVSRLSLVPEDSQDKNEAFVRVIEFDQNGMLWAGTNESVFLINTRQQTCEKFALPLAGTGRDEIWELFQDKNGDMWIGTYSNGVFVVDSESKEIEPVDLGSSFERTKTVRSISEGAHGNYWIGTRGGIFVYSKNDGVAAYYHNDERESTSLINNSVLDIVHDSRGEAWIGTRGGLNLLAKNKQVFENYIPHPSDDGNKYLNSSIVYAFWIDGEQNIWVGTEDGGINIYHPQTKNYSYLRARVDDPKSISRDCIKAFQEDKKGNLWVGTFLGGVDVVNLKTKKVVRHFDANPSNEGSISDNKIWDFLLDHNGNMWVGTSAGIDRYDSQNDKFIHYPQLAGQEQVNWMEMDSFRRIWFGTSDMVGIYDPESKKVTRFSEHSRAFVEDSKGRYWLTTLDKGIAQYSSVNGALQYYDTEDGLSNDQALCVLEDNSGKLWVSTSNGLSKFDPERETFQNFTSKDGLRSNQFSYGAAYRAEDGRLLFGGVSGFNIFNPKEVKLEDGDVPLVLTDLRIFNKKVPINSDKGVLTKSISETKHLVLPYEQNVFTLEFAALNYVNSQNNLYSYYLEGFDKDWNEPSQNRTATYTNLNPDDYMLHVKRVVPGKTELGSELSLMVTILPPFWKTIWFRGLIILIICVLIYLLIQFFLYREKIKSELILERMKARKLHELDMLKLKFFTNVSHEIRTPLTLILAPLEKLIKQKVTTPEVSANLDMMHRNAKQLDRLVNQLLDFRKLESGNLKLELVQGDIVSFISKIVESFQGYADEKDIQLKFNSLKKNLTARFDADKLEKMINNLLSNAFKFTGKDGQITVNLSLIFDTNEEDLASENPDKEFIEITVRDTGQGISQTNASKIFNRFFQANEKQVQTGAGIGLSYVKELVKLHHGKIYVVSKPGKGSKFTIRLPYVKGELVETPPETEALNDSGVGTTNESNLVREPEHLNSRIMLVVDDNPDVRKLISSHFDSRFQVFEAADGRIGLKMALEQVPDVIVSDVLMPDIDGYEFCKKVKKDERISHIPVLLLTALHSKDHEIKGLSSGADDYITKPFDLAILQTKIENMLSIRDSLKQKYSGEITLQPKNIIISSPEEKFLQKAVEVVENNIADTDLDIERFAQEVGVSRMQLYRKLNALTDMTVKEFIRSIRLKRATQLLLQEKMTVSEIAYAVGFKDLSHFRKCFRQTYGMNATEYKQKN
ncbi:hybrid sensor histidine kinase/response regulator transcription factor [Sunxiuqinia indica]|uniref:hybrid sensor histidine kinase/response regulator transcription factor n=1 Tax=Sunxiuqinia indica TaxID=2692584 RepID=UPI0013569FCC|nr:two-component regulator propeller domain-containing protein [Sunxiuqinia indica]